MTRVKEGQEVEIQPRLIGTKNGPLPIEQKKFRGKITFVDIQIAAVAEEAVRIYAEIENPTHELLDPGFKAQLTIDLGEGTLHASRGAEGGGQNRARGRRPLTHNNTLPLAKGELEGVLDGLGPCAQEPPSIPPPGGGKAELCDALDLSETPLAEGR